MRCFWKGKACTGCTWLSVSCCLASQQQRRFQLVCLSDCKICDKTIQDANLVMQHLGAALLPLCSLANMLPEAGPAVSADKLMASQAPPGQVLSSSKQACKPGIRIAWM